MISSNIEIKLEKKVFKFKENLALLNSYRFCVFTEKTIVCPDITWQE